MDKINQETKVLEGNEKPTESVENNTSVKEQLLSVGEQRYEKTAKFITGAGDKLKGWISRGASKFGSFFKGAVVRALATPDAIAYGTKVAGEKIGEEAGYVKEGVVTGANFVGEKVVEGFKSVGDDINQFDKYTDKKVEQVGEWIGYNATSAYEYTSENIQKARNFTAEKAGQAGDYLKDKALTAEALGSLAVDKTVEKYQKVKEGLGENYTKLMKFGESAIDTAKLRTWYAKDSFYGKLNAWNKAMLERKEKIQREKYEKTLKKLAQYQKVGGLQPQLA